VKEGGVAKCPGVVSELYSLSLLVPWRGAFVSSVLLAAHQDMDVSESSVESAGSGGEGSAEGSEQGRPSLVEGEGNEGAAEWEQVQASGWVVSACSFAPR
jgi:hypothetical protein